MKKGKSIIALLIVIALLAGGLVAYTLWENNRGTDPGETTTAGTTEYLIDLEIEDVDSLEVTNAGGKFVWVTKTTTAEGTDGESKETTSFELREPEIANLDQSAAEGKAKDFLNVVVDSVASENAEDLSVYGLDEPFATAVIKLKDGTEKTLYMGDVLRNETRLAYARVDDSNRVVVASGIISMMDFKATDLVSGTLVPFKLYETDSFRFVRKRDGMNMKAETFEPPLVPNVSPTPTPEAEPTEDELNQIAMTRSWQITEPYEWEGDAADINTMVSEFQAVSAADIVETEIDDPAKYGLDDPDYQFTLFSTDDEEVTISLGKEESSGKRYMSVSGRDELMLVNMANFTMIDRPQVELVNSFISLINIENVGNITLKTPEGEYDMDVFHPSAAEKKENENLEFKYTINGQDASVADSSDNYYFRKLYSSILSVMIDGQDLEASPEGEPQFTITITKRTGDKETVKIDLLERDGESYYIFKNGKYTGFYTRRTRLDNETDNVDNIGLLQWVERMQTAMDNAVDGVYDFPEED